MTDDFVMDLFPEEETSDFQDSQYPEVVKDSGQTHPAMTTPFTDYTVTEALLLICLLFAFSAACIRILKGGFPWLR